MFDWFRKGKTQVSDEKLSDAYEMGRRAAVSASADLKTYMQARFYPHIPVIIEKVFGEFDTPDMPPLVAARVDLKSFVENIDDLLRPRVVPQIFQEMSRWLDAFKTMGLATELERLIEHEYESLKSSVVLAALQKLLDLTDMLKEADEKWRATNTEKAADIPVDMFGAELAETLAPYLKR